MSSKSMFKLSDHEHRRGDAPMNSPFIGRQQYNRNDGGYASIEESLRHSPQLLWQALTPEVRSETLRKAQLIQLLRQVNPNLQLCRRSAAQTSSSTAEKGVQVPDVRYEVPIQRKFPSRKEVKSTLVAPGVRIQPRGQGGYVPETSDNQELQDSNKDSSEPINDFSANQRSVYATKTTGLKVTLNTGWPERKVTVSHEQRQSLDDAGNKSNSKSDNRNQLKDFDVQIVSEDNKPEELSNERQVNKSKDCSSGDEDSVVVVLDEPPSEQGLERKYGQFFCRRCLRGWSSRSVWCLRNTCKVYIKQTCNSCNKLVNPYLVCRLPKSDGASKETNDSGE